MRDSNSPGCHPVDGLAGRSLTRSANSPSDDTMSLLRTRSAIRTHTVRALNAVPPAVGLPGHVMDLIHPLWTTSVSNRAGAVCRTALHTCASPERASEEARTRRAALAWVPSAGLEPALDGPSDRCLLPLGYEGVPLGAAISGMANRHTSVVLRGHRDGMAASTGVEPVFPG